MRRIRIPRHDCQTGAPNRLTSGRDVRNEVATRLRRAGLATELRADGVMAVKAAIGSSA